MNSRQILDELSRYLPEGCICEGDHVPVAGTGAWYTDADDMRHLDFTSGIFTNTFGHAPDLLNKVRQDQTQALSNVHGRHTLAELLFYQRLYKHLPVQDYKAIPYNDGSYAIDRALSDLINYFGRERIVIAALQGAFHGKTQAAKLLINETKQAALFENIQLPFPDCRRCPWGMNPGTCEKTCIVQTKKALREKNVRVLIFEPVQGAAVRIPPQGFWKSIADFCASEKILLFADEVLTGGGRTGRYLACEHDGIVPDVIVLTKGLANGQPLSVILERCFITDNPYGRRFMERSSTFAAHPEALAVAAEVLRLLEEENILQHTVQTGQLLKDGLAQLRQKYSAVTDVRSIGLMAAVEFDKPGTTDPDDALCRRIYECCRKRGLELIYSGYCLRIAPPLNISAPDLTHGLRILEQAIDECTNGDAL